MTLLKNMNDYNTDATNYWYTQIDNTSYTNKDNMKSTIDTYLTDLVLAYNTYKSSLDRSLMTNLILALYNYLMQKYQVQIQDPDCPPIDNLDFVLTDLYHSWTYTLPDYTQLFTISGDSSEGTIDTTDIYAQLKQNIKSEFAQADNIQIKFERIHSVASKTSEIALYRIIKQPKITCVDIDIKSMILNDFKLQDVMDEFNWTWKAFD